MAGSFQFLHSRDLIWTRRMREYLMGEREQRSDLMAWNADTTRMPARMHHEYLIALYLHNDLASSAYRVDGHAVSLTDIGVPVFLVGTERDHISPWRSVYKLHHLCDTEITFVLTNGGHNAGIVSEPGHAGRSYRIACGPPTAPGCRAAEWLRQAPRHEGSWWPAWHAWLAARSSPLQPAHADPAAGGPGRRAGRIRARALRRLTRRHGAGVLRRQRPPGCRGRRASTSWPPRATARPASPSGSAAGSPRCCRRRRRAPAVPPPAARPRLGSLPLEALPVMGKAAADGALRRRR